MVHTTLCYIEKDNKYLMLHRVKKEHDVNKDKWIGIGGKFEEGETPEQCVLREVMEETGLTLTAIMGEPEAKPAEVAGNLTVSFTPYCTTQNLCGAYSILLHTFLCCAEGEPLTSTDETQNIGWMPIDMLRERLLAHPEDFFFMQHCSICKDADFCIRDI